MVFLCEPTGAAEFFGGPFRVGNKVGKKGVDRPKWMW
jgi:hypothetical protein